MFDKAIDRIRHHFGIWTLEDWRKVTPEWIRGLDGVGQATLDHIRIYLAMRGVTLKDDQTVEYWKARLGNLRIAKALSVDDLQVKAPFTVLVDTREQQPFGFERIPVDASETPNDLKRMIANEEIEQSDLRLYVPTRFESLGNSHGDYSIEGFAGRAHIERKSQDDAYGTILGWGDRREQFERTLETLAGMECAAIVIECSWEQLLKQAPSHGKKTSNENRKAIFRQVVTSWKQDFRVPWEFCTDRRMAEITTYRILNRFWQKQMKRRKAAVAPVQLDPQVTSMIDSL